MKFKKTAALFLTAILVLENALPLQAASAMQTEAAEEHYSGPPPEEELPSAGKNISTESENQAADPAEKPEQPEETFNEPSASNDHPENPSEILSKTDEQPETEIPALKDTFSDDSANSSAVITESFELPEGTLTDSGTLSDGSTWTLDSAGTFTVSAVPKGNPYAFGSCITQIDGLSETAKEQVKTIYFKKGLWQQGTYDDSLFPHADTLVIGKDIEAYYDSENINIKNLWILGKNHENQDQHISLDKYHSLEEIQVTGNINNFHISSCTALKNITASGTVENIYVTNCTSLQEIYIEKWIGDGKLYSSFHGNTALESIVVNEMTSDTWQLLGAVFKNCGNLKKIQIPARLVEIRGEMYSLQSSPFYGCNSLEDYPDFSHVRLLGDAAFKNCTNLREVVLPNLENQQEFSDAFYGCTNLERVSLSGPQLETVSLDNSNFRDCTSLKSVQIDADITKVGIQEFAGCTSLTEFPDFDSLTSIGDRAFHNCIGLDHIFVGETLERIGNSSFEGCTGLKQAYFHGLKNWNVSDTSKFKNCTSLKTLTIQEMEAPIPLGGSNFLNCSSLETLNLPAGISSIGSSDFYGCNSLRALPDLSNLASVSTSNTFRGCSSLREVVFPETAEFRTSGESMFQDCTSLKKVVMPVKTGELNSCMFQNCTNLEQLEGLDRSENLTTIKKDAFKGCKKLTTLELPKVLRSISSLPDGLEYFEIPENLTNIQTLFANTPDLKEVVIPESVDKMAKAFQNHEKLEKVFFSGTNQSISEFTFSGCTGLKEIQLPAGLTEIRESAFSGCSSLESLQLPQELTAIGRCAFQGCSSLSSLELPADLVSIGAYAFSDSGLREIRIPEQITVIEEGTFSQCSNLEYAELANGLTEIKTSAFSQTGLSDLTLSQTRLEILYGAFSDSSDKIILMNDKLRLHTNAISNTREIIFDSSDVEMDHSALTMPAGKANVYFLQGALQFASGSGGGSISQNDEPDIDNHLYIYIAPEVHAISGIMTKCGNVTIVGETGSLAEEYAARNRYAFQAADFIGTEDPDNPGLTENIKDNFQYRIENEEATLLRYIGRSGDVSVPETLNGYPVTRIAKGTFTSRILASAGESIRSITLPSTVKTVEPGAVSSWIYYMKDINISSDNPYLSAEDGVLYNKEKTRLLQIMPGVTEFSIPDTVETISSRAFSACKVREITVPASVRTLEEEAFASGNLTKVTFEQGIETIGERAFAGSKALKEISLPDTLHFIKDEAFMDCGLLNTIVIPEGVTMIHARAFCGCRKLLTMELPDTVEFIGNEAFAQSGLHTFTAGSVNIIGSNILDGTSGTYYAPYGTSMWNYLKQHYGSHLGNGAAVGGYVVGIDVADDYGSKFLSQAGLMGYNLKFSKEMQIGKGELKVMSMRDDKELASISLTGTDKPQDSIPVPLAPDQILPSDTEVYITLTEGTLTCGGITVSQWSSKGCWSKNTMPDCWNYKNPTEEIPYSILSYMCPSSLKRKKLAKNKSDGTGGICFGMAASAALINEGKPDIQSFGKLTKEMFKANKMSYSSELSITVRDFWQLSYLMQLDKAVSKELKKNKNKTDQMLDSISKMLNGTGKPCIISMEIEKDGWHALLPYYMEDHSSDGTENYIDIYVYDCNSWMAENVLRFTMSSGKVFHWNYQGEQISDTAGFGIGFYELDSDTFFQKIKSYGNSMGRNATLSLEKESSQPDSFDTGSRMLEVITDSSRPLPGTVHMTAGTLTGDVTGNTSSGDLLIPIEIMADDSKDSGKENLKRRLYWLDEDDSPLEVQKLPAHVQVSLADNSSVITAGASRESSIVMQTADTSDEQTQLSITLKRKGIFDFELEYAPEQGERFADSVQISGTTAQTVQVKDESQGFTLSGEQNAVITVEKDGQQIQRNVTDTEQYDQLHITLEQDSKNKKINIVVQADTDGDGKPDIIIPAEGGTPDSPDDPDKPENPDKPADTQKVTSITLSRTKVSLYPSQTLFLTAKAAPVSASDRSITFTSTNPKVADVSHTGTVTAKSPGSAQIRAEANDGSKTTAICTITVKAAKVKLNASKIPIQQKKSSTSLKVTQITEGDKILSWSSSHPKIVSVTTSGKIKAKKKNGKAIITVLTRFGAKASCTVTVQKKKVKLKSFTAIGKEQTIRKNKVTLKKGKKLTLIVNRNPITASEKIRFTSSSPITASITQKGIITAKKKGKCKIIMRSSNGKKKSITVIVK